CFGMFPSRDGVASFAGGAGAGKGAAMRLAVIGCGKQGRRHLAAVAGLPGIGGLIVADENAARAADACAAVGALAVPAADIFDGDADAVVIATPTATHLDLARRAIDAGKHVLCEKPFGGEPAAAQILADEAARRGLVGRVGYLYRFAPAIASARSGRRVSPSPPRAIMPRGNTGAMRAAARSTSWRRIWSIWRCGFSARRHAKHGRSAGRARRGASAASRSRRMPRIGSWRGSENA